MNEDVRAYARLQLQISGSDMTRASYTKAVLDYAISKHGDNQDVRMFAERTARWLWDSHK